MDANNKHSVALADAQAVVESITTGEPLDPAIARRIEQQAKQVREELLRTRGVQDIGVQLIRAARGALDEERETELTLVQRDLLHKGQLRLLDPDSGTSYVLVPQEEYERLHSTL